MYSRLKSTLARTFSFSYRVERYEWEIHMLNILPALQLLKGIRDLLGKVGKSQEFIAKQRSHTNSDQCKEWQMGPEPPHCSSWKSTAVAQALLIPENRV